jgi:predicted ATP-grasp superfamily ATP-dependent carboligase
VKILIVGVSTRAIAESAVRSRPGVITLDYFGDRDQRALVENYSLLRDFKLPFSAKALLQASRQLKFDAVVYISNLENHPAVVKKLAQGRVLLGNSEAVLRQVRDWRALRQCCGAEEILCPVTLLPGEERKADPSVGWLHKPILSGGGCGIKFWNGQPIDEAHILQAHVEGRPASMAFAADGQRSVIIGLTEQIIGRKELGAKGYRWCGNILPLKLDASKKDAFIGVIEKIAARLTRRFGLRGVNGVDIVIAQGRDGEPCPFLVEVNPRYSASMELVERAYGLNVFSAHLDALEGRLPDFSLAEHLEGHYLGKGIVFARKTVTMPETKDWEKRGRRDIPCPGERIEAGHPICTVLAEGEERETCLNNLLASVEDMRWETGDEHGELI